MSERVVTAGVVLRTKAFAPGNAVHIRTDLATMSIDTWWCVTHSQMIIVAHCKMLNQIVHRVHADDVYVTFLNKILLRLPRLSCVG